MKINIAVPTDDGETISRHFGQAKFFKVITLEEGQAVNFELRPKASHQHDAQPHALGEHPGQHMLENIADCQVLISGGMGEPAFTRAGAAGLSVILTPEPSIDAAVSQYLAGTLQNHTNLVHAHH